MNKLTNLPPGTFLPVLALLLLALPRSAGATGSGFLGVLFAGAVDVSAEVAGVVDEVHVALGDEVEPGALLVSLESQDLRSSWRQAEAALRTAEARVVEADAELTEIERLLERRRGAPEIFTTQQLEGLETRRDVAAAEREGARSTVAERVVYLDELARRVAALDVKAPFAGAVAGRHHDVGARVVAGESLIRLISGDIWVRFAVPSRESDWLAVDREVIVEPERSAGSWPAVVRRIAPEIDPGTDMIFVEASLVLPVESGSRLRSGEVVRVRFSRD